MNIKDWAEKFAAGIHEWVTSVEDNLNVDLGDIDDNYEQQAKEELNGESNEW